MKSLKHLNRWKRSRRNQFQVPSTMLIIQLNMEHQCIMWIDLFSTQYSNMTNHQNQVWPMSYQQLIQYLLKCRPWISLWPIWLLNILLPYRILAYLKLDSRVMLESLLLDRSHCGHVIRCLLKKSCRWRSHRLLPRLRCLSSLPGPSSTSRVMFRLVMQDLHMILHPELI